MRRSISGPNPVPQPEFFDPTVWEILDADELYVRPRRPIQRHRAEDAGHWKGLRGAEVEPAPDRGVGCVWVALGDGEVRGWLADFGISKFRWDRLQPEERKLVYGAIHSLLRMPSIVAQYVRDCAPTEGARAADPAIQVKAKRMVTALEGVLARDAKDRAGYFPTKRRKQQQAAALALLPELRTELFEILREAERAESKRITGSVWDEPRWAAAALQRVRRFLRERGVDWWKEKGCPDCIGERVHSLELGDAHALAKQILLEVFTAVSDEFLERGSVKKRTKRSASSLNKPSRG